MTKYLCDVCGQETTEDGLYTMSFTVKTTGTFNQRKKTIDFCEHCYKDFVEKQSIFIENYLKRVDK